jgi:putative endonuclease
MVKLTTIGAKGEQVAVDFLQKKGYKIINRNWRSGKKEIDIVATLKDTLVFLEIKTRSNLDFGFPEESVTKAKQKFLKQAAEAYVAANPGHEYIRFDIVSIVMVGDNVKEIVHFEEAFY